MTAGAADRRPLGSDGVLVPPLVQSAHGDDLQHQQSAFPRVALWGFKDIHRKCSGSNTTTYVLITVTPLLIASSIMRPFVPGDRHAAVGPEADDQHSQFHGVCLGSLHRTDQGSQRCQVWTGGVTRVVVDGSRDTGQPALHQPEGVPPRGALLRLSCGRCRHWGGGLTLRPDTLQWLFLGSFFFFFFFAWREFQPFTIFNSNNEKTNVRWCYIKRQIKGSLTTSSPRFYINTFIRFVNGTSVSHIWLQFLFFSLCAIPGL